MNPLRPSRPGTRPPVGRRAPRNRRRSHRLLAVLVVSGLLVAGSPAAAGEPPDAAAPLAAAGTGELTTVTLLTGDRVNLSASSGGVPHLAVDPAPRPNGFVPQFHVTTTGGDVYVMPSDVARYVPQRIDRELFNVTALVEAGLDDTHSDTIPVIITHPDGPAPMSAADLPALTGSRQLPVVAATAASLVKAEASEMAAALNRAGGTATRSTAAAAQPLPGVAKIWWDRPVQAALDESTAQIGVGAARAAGLDGAGVTVAVLDTGVDETHPDLAGRVVASADFTQSEPLPPEPGPLADGHGHGTHVASIIAGSGAASDGRYQGVAPGVSLLDGKVLDDGGNGITSWIIAGMQWAADNGADIVNMSLGSNASNPLIIDTVEQLTADHDMLFVVAAGNAGCDGCIASPGDAPSALTVGAVDGDDALAEFSSRGPTRQTRLLKPELTAPGVAITAARSAQLPGDGGPYHDMSGTSMATPHVAGAAAVLAQAYPDLGPEELQGALVGTAVPGDDLTVYEQGAGRVDVRRLLTAPVLALSDPLDLGVVPHPRSPDDPARRTVRYRNTSDQPVTLELSAMLADEQGAPVGTTVVTTAPSTLTVPAGGTAEAEVTIDVAAVGPGQYGGFVIADGPGGALRTPVSFFNEREWVDVTFDVVMRDGRTALRPFILTALNLDDGKLYFQPCSEDDSWEDPPCARMPVGTYAVMAYVPTAARWHEGAPDFLSPPLHTALVGDPELTVDRDMTVTLDARDAVEVTVDTPEHETKRNLGAAEKLAWHRQTADGQVFTDQLLNGPGSQLQERLFVQPTDPVTSGDFSVSTRWRLAQPRITLTVDGHEQTALEPYYYRSDFFTANPLLDGVYHLPLVDVGEADPAEIDAAGLDGALALVRRSDATPVPEQVARAADAGARMVAVYHDRPGVSSDPGQLQVPMAVPTVRLSHEEGMALRALLADGPVTVRAEGRPASPYLYDLVYTERGQVPSELHYTADPDRLARVAREFHTQLGDSPGYAETAYPRLPWEFASFAISRPVWDAPRTRMEFRTTQPEWTYGIRVPESLTESLQLGFTSETTSYQPGERVRHRELRQPLRPALPPHTPPARWRDLMFLPLVGLRDGAGGFGELFDLPGFDSSVRLWRGEELLHESPRGGADGQFIPLIELPPQEETYRLEYQFTNAQPWAALSTRARTEWTFRSAHADVPPDQPVVPALLSLDYQIPLDLTNRSLPARERRGPPTVEVAVGHIPGVDGPAIEGARLWVSYDDGVTWQERSTRGQGGADGRYEFIVPDRRDRYVSLRVEAWDADGNRIEQEIIRAYAAADR